LNADKKEYTATEVNRMLQEARQEEQQQNQNKGFLGWIMPGFSPTIPAYSTTSPAYYPTRPSPAYAEIEAPAYSTTSPAYYPTRPSPAYAEIEAKRADDAAKPDNCDFLATSSDSSESAYTASEIRGMSPDRHI